MAPSAPVTRGRGQERAGGGTSLWLDLKPADPDGIALLRDVFQFHPLAIEARH